MLADLPTSLQVGVVNQVFRRHARRVVEDLLFDFASDGRGIDLRADVADLTGNGREGRKISGIIGQFLIGIQREIEVSGRILLVDDRLAHQAASDEVAAEVPPGRVVSPADCAESRSRFEIPTVIEVGGGDLVAPVVLFQRQPIRCGFLRRDEGCLAAALGEYLDLRFDPPRQLWGTRAVP